ncbi:MAG: hypothetical protein KAJ69_02175, partial [Thermoplasmatales archaeon]|nr:hypothetical protein [Thermoplasmatales archaeon]
MTKKKEKSLHRYKAVFVTLTLIILSLSAFAGTESEIDNNQVLTMAYSFDVPYLEKLSIDDNIYDKVILPGAPSIADPGEPCLPVKGAYILLPKNTQVSKIYVTSSEKVYLGSDFYIEPSGKPVPLSMANLAKPPEPDPSIYDSNDPFPSVLFTEVGTYSLRGYDVLVLSLHPVQYIPAKGELFYFNNITVSVELVEDKTTNSLFRGLMNDKLEITKKVDNPAIVDTYTKKITARPVLKQYDFLILTTDELKNSFEPLKNAHDSEGIKTEIKTLRDISLIPDSITPEDIRDFIKDEYLNSGIEYVLLGGDADVVLAKMLYVFGLDEGTVPYETEMPSDLYYACLDGPYNFDGDNKWGEPTDGEDGGDVDLLAEVYVGRASVDNIDDAERFVDKTIAYIYSHQNDDDYLKKFLFAGERLGDWGIATWGGNYLDQLIDSSTDDGYSTTGIPSDKYEISTLYDRDNSWPTSEIITLINDGFHVVQHDGHSNYNYNLKLSSSDIDAFTNEKYCFVYSNGCMAGGFDNGDCFAEYMTVKTENGAFAGIWNARYGWFWAYSTDGDSQRFAREFWDAVFDENITEISKANQDSKEDNLYIIGRSCIRWCYYQLNLFGDPTLAFYNNANNPPNKPAKPTGVKKGAVGEEYNFSTSTTDQDEDMIYYKWDWGDGTFSGWLGPFNSGEEISITHQWSRL